jgi:hypothetical protein
MELQLFLHILTPHKLKTVIISVLYSGSWILLINPFTSVILYLYTVLVLVQYSTALLAGETSLYFSVLF